MKKKFAIIYLVAFSPAVTYAADRSCIKDGKLQDGCKLDNQNALGIPFHGFETTASNIVAILGIIAGSLSVLFLIIGGINYITSEGDPTKLKNAKSTITYAIAGLAVSFLAPAIVGLVLQYTPK